VIPLFVTAIAGGVPVRIEGDGEQRRDFTYVSNVVDGTIRAAEAEGANGRIFNVAASAPASVNQVADTIGAILERPVNRMFAPPRAGDIRDSWADVTAAREVLGWEPTVGLEEGLRKTIAALV
jgi:UDP-glucose 4-epimerase